MSQAQEPLPVVAFRESACPVHFVWDGFGAGRWLVRVGFLGFLIAGTLATLATMLSTPAWRTAGGAVGLVAVALWGAGQLVTAVARRRARSR